MDFILNYEIRLMTNTRGHHTWHQTKAYNFFRGYSRRTKSAVVKAISSLGRNGGFQ